MNDQKRAAWDAFAQTGKITDYLAYCEIAKELTPEDVYHANDHRRAALYSIETCLHSIDY